MLKKLTSDFLHSSPVAAIVQEAKQLLRSEREYSLAHVCRGQNKVAHTLAQMGRSSYRTAVWLRHGPDEIKHLCQEDSNEPP